MNNVLKHQLMVNRLSNAVIFVFLFYIVLSVIVTLSKRNRHKLAADKSTIKDNGLHRKSSHIKSIASLFRAAFEPLVEFCVGCTRSLQAEDLVKFVRSNEALLADLIKFATGFVIFMTIMNIYVYEDSVTGATGYPVIDDAIATLPYLMIFSLIAFIDFPGLKLMGGKASLRQTLMTSCFVYFAFCPMMMAITMVIAELEIPTVHTSRQIINLIIGLVVALFQIKALSILHDISTDRVFLAKFLGYGTLLGSAFSLRMFL